MTGIETPCQVLVTRTLQAAPPKAPLRGSRSAAELPRPWVRH